MKRTRCILKDETLRIIINTALMSYSPNVHFTFLNKKLMSYTVSTFIITMFDVQLQDDMASYPGLF